MLAFIYGTLKRGHRANHLLAGQYFLASATTAPGWRLYDCGGFPGLVRDAKGAVVRGEIWEIDADTLGRLDDYEGVAESIYARGEVMLADGTRAATYLYLRSTEGLRDCGEAWSIENESADPST